MAKSRKIAQPIDMLGNSIENCPTVNNKVSTEPQTLTTTQKAQVRANIGLDKVDNTSDANKQVFEANLRWGGRNIIDTCGPIDAAMISDLGANRFAFLTAAGITVEYSRDNGETWTDYGALDINKSGQLFGVGRLAFYIGGKSETGVDKSSHQLRVTVDVIVGKCYTILHKFAIFVSTNGTQNCWCTIDGKTVSNVATGNDAWTVFADKVGIAGWSGWNIINIGDTITLASNSMQSSYYQKVRFTFGGKHDTESNKKYGGLAVAQIMAFGGVGWTTPSNLAKNGHLYGMDANQNALFPSEIFEGGTTDAYRLTNKYAPKNVIDATSIINGNKVFTGSVTLKSAIKSKLILDSTGINEGYINFYKDGATVGYFGVYNGKPVWSGSQIPTLPISTSDIKFCEQSARVLPLIEQLYYPQRYNLFWSLADDQITFENSTDGGKTWAETASPNTNKYRIASPFENIGLPLNSDASTIDTPNDMLRITFDMKDKQYGMLKKVMINSALPYTKNYFIYCKVELQKVLNNVEADWITYIEDVKIEGNTGISSVKVDTLLGGSLTKNNYKKIRFTFYIKENAIAVGTNRITKIIPIYSLIYSDSTGNYYSRFGVPYVHQKGYTTFDAQVVTPHCISTKDIYENGKSLASQYVKQVSGKGLSTNDYTAEDKSKLDGIAAGATKTIVENELTVGSTNAIANGVVADKFKEIETEISGLPTTSYVDSAIRDVNEKLADKQEKLISGTNIKTINGASILGNGNITISGSGGLAPVEVTNGDIDDAVTDIEIDSGSILQFGGKMYHPHFDINTIKALKEGVKWPYDAANSICTGSCGETLSDNGDYIGMFINKIDWSPGSSGPAISGMDMLVVWKHRYNDAGVDIYIIERVNY